MKAIACIFLFAAGIFSPDIRYFQYQRPLVNIQDHAGQSCVTLDPAIFAHASAELSDLRLYSGAAEVPYLVRTSERIDPGEKPIRPLNLGRQGADTVFDAAMPEGSYSDLDLGLSGQDFIATVTVSGGNLPSGGAETVLGVYTIFDLTSQKLGRSTVLHLPESNFHFLHFRINGPVKPDAVSNVSVETLAVTQPKFTTVAESGQSTAKKHLTIFEFTVPAHVPVDRIVFTPRAEPANFSRDVTVSIAETQPKAAMDESEPPTPLTTRGSLLRVHRVEEGKRIDEERLIIDASALNSESPTKWTITIDNRDDRPLMPQLVSLQMLERDICFEAAAGAHYALYYGDSVLPAPHYDYATLYSGQANPTRAVLGPEQKNPEFRPRPDERAFTERHPALLWGVLLAVIILLGLITLRAVSRATPPGANQM